MTHFYKCQIKSWLLQISPTMHTPPNAGTGKPIRPALAKHHEY